MKTFHLQQSLDITNLDITSLYITNLYISTLYITNLDITKFYITNLDITKYLGITNVFFTPVIVKYMKKNLVIANILICQSLGPSLYRGSTVLIIPGFKPFTIKRKFPVEKAGIVRNKIYKSYLVVI